MNNSGPNFKPKLKVEDDAGLHASPLAGIDDEESLASTKPQENNADSENGFDADAHNLRAIAEDNEAQASVEAYREKVRKRRKIGQVCLILFSVILVSYACTILKTGKLANDSLLAA